MAGEPTSIPGIVATGAALLFLVFVLPPLVLWCGHRIRGAWRDIQRPIR